MQPLVSIIVPVYDVEAFLPKCVESILAQTYTNWELFLVDDGSPDRCPALCDEYAAADSRITALHKENGGQGTARNMALDVCRGDYIAFVDSDDWIKPTMLQTMMEALLTNEADMALCGAAFENGIYTVEQPPFAQPVLMTAEELLTAYVTTNTILSVMWNKIYKRSLFDGIRFPRFRAREDAYILHILLGGSQKAVHVGECLYVQYVRPGSTEFSPFSEKKLGVIDSAEAMMDYYAQNHPSLYGLVAYRGIEARIGCMKDILSSRMLRQYSALYAQLQDEAVREFAEVSKTYPLAGQLKAQYQLALTAPKEFMRSVRREARVTRLKNTVKRVLLWLKTRR